MLRHPAGSAEADGDARPDAALLGPTGTQLRPPHRVGRTSHLTTSRTWIGRRADGATLEVAVGTGLNLPHYGDAVTLTGVDWSEAMLIVARRRAEALSRPMTFERADAGALPFGSGRFDTVVCTFGLCCVPDERAASSASTSSRPNE